MDKIKKIASDIDGQDIIAVCVILGGFYLMANGKDGIVGAAITAVVAYYFGGKRFAKDIPKIIEKIIPEIKKNLKK